MKRTTPLLFVLLVTAVACQRQIRAALPDAGLIVEAESAFWSGDYPRAAEIYTRLLEFESEPERERAMFRLALVQGLGVLPSGDAVTSVDYRGRLAAEYPASPLNAEIDPTVSLLSERHELTEALENRSAERDSQAAEIRRLDTELGEVRTEFAAFEDVLDATRLFQVILLSEESRSDPAELQAADSAEPADPQEEVAGEGPDPVATELVRLSQDWARFVAAYPGTTLATEAELMIGLLAEIHRLRQTRTTQSGRIDGLASDVERLSEELEKLRAADRRRRLPN